MLHNEERFTPTLAYMAGRADVIADGQVSGLRTEKAGEHDVTYLTLDIRDTPGDRRQAPSEAEVLALGPLPEIAVSFFGTLFLMRRPAVRDAAASRGAPKGPAKRWLLPWGSHGILASSSEDYRALHAYVLRIVNGYEDAVDLALNGLASPMERLRIEAANDLNRVWDVADRLSSEDVDRLLATVRDRDYPDRERAQLIDILARVPDFAPALQRHVISLVQSGLRGYGFLSQAIDILANSDEAGSFEVLMQLADDDDFRVAEYALYGLGRIGSAEALRRVAVAKERHQDPDVREAARRILVLQ